MPDNVSYKFGPFVLEPYDATLRRDGEAVSIQPLTLKVLLALVRRRGRLVTKGELLREAWGDDSDVYESAVGFQISQLRKTLGDDASKPAYVKTEPGLGFRFISEVIEVSGDAGREGGEVAAQAQAAGGGRRHLFPRGWKGWALLCVVAVTVAAGVYFAWKRMRNPAARPATNRVQVRSPSDEAEVMRVVKESQVYETLTIYTNPEAFDPKQLDRYWMSTAQGGKAIPAIEAAVQRLRQKGWRYDSQSRLEIFDFRYVRIFSPRDYAEAGTSERWYVPTVRKDGSRVEDRNVYLGIYDVDYTLRKIDGRWLIEENSTPRPQPNNNQNK